MAEHLAAIKNSNLTQSYSTFPINLLFMAFWVSAYDLCQGVSPARVFKKSYARLKRHGYTGMAARLIKEYCRAKGRSIPISIEENYSAWIEHVEPTLVLPRCADPGFSISLLMPVYNPEPSHLCRAIESVLAQSSPFWELCICDDASTFPHVRESLSRYARQDSRIKVVYRDTCGNISVATNAALALATQEYVAFMDHDDELAPSAINELIAGFSSGLFDLLYSDEDKIDATGVRFSPHFKPDFSPDLLLSQNYISHLTAIRRSPVETVGGLRTGYEGSQDYDLLLRLVRAIPRERVGHIPKILYHWRAGSGSTAQDPSAKGYAAAAGLLALRDYLAKGALPARAEEGKFANTYRIFWPLTDLQPLVSIIIPTRDQVTYLRRCIDGLLERTDYDNMEILIVDNDSTEAATKEYFELLSEDKRIRFLSYPEAFNYSAINNMAVSKAAGEIICLLNNDVDVISAGWLREMVSHASRPEIGCVGAKLYFPDDTIQHAGVILGIGGVAGHGHKYLPRDSRGYFDRLNLVHNVSAVTAACLVVRKEIFHQVGGLDSLNLRVAFNDVDFCLKVKEAGFLNLWTPHAELYHHESKSRGADNTPAKERRHVSEILYMRKKWGVLAEADPYYNPNLTRQFEQFQIKSYNQPATHWFEEGALDSE